MSAKFTIKEIFADHWDSFLLENPNVRPVVDSEVRKVIGCGDPDNGCAFYVCPDCGAYKFVPFRCHSRFCNTCSTLCEKICKLFFIQMHFVGNKCPKQIFSLLPHRKCGMISG